MGLLKQVCLVSAFLYLKRSEYEESVVCNRKWGGLGSGKEKPLVLCKVYKCVRK